MEGTVVVTRYSSALERVPECSRVCCKEHRLPNQGSLGLGAHAALLCRALGFERKRGP